MQAGGCIGMLPRKGEGAGQEKMDVNGKWLLCVVLSCDMSISVQFPPDSENSPHPIDSKGLEMFKLALAISP